MIEKIKLKFGIAPKQENLEIEISPVTVFVGPNNSGKSRALIEIENYSRRAMGQPGDLIIDKVFFSTLTPEEIEKEIEILEQKPNRNETINPGHIIIAKVNPQNNQLARLQVNKQGLMTEAQNPNSSRNHLPAYLTIFTLRLDGTNRLNLLNEQNAGDLQISSLNHLAHIFHNNDVRKEVRRIVYEAFGKYLVIDPTNIGKFRVRLSDREPVDEREEKGWESPSINFHKDALLITDASDGVKAFSGIITTLLAGDPKITLIDEPEAFLHPALSSKLGKEIGKSLKGSRKRLFVATHSSSFVMGCIQSGAPINIVRLTYKNEVPTARLLPKEKILHLMRHPMLRSTGVLNGLFYESVIVTEGDSDRAFYQEINERLVSANDPRGISNCLFINAQNKQTVWEIVKPLRELGIPTVGIVDIDVLKEGGQVFSKLLNSVFIPQISHEGYQRSRNNLKDALNKTGKNWKVEGGIDLLDKETSEACENFFNQLNEYGVFSVKRGELESWLKDLDATGHGSNWLVNIFSRMGVDPESDDYVNPSSGDVWDFLGEVKEWIENPTRKGIPQTY